MMEAHAGEIRRPAMEKKMIGEQTDELVESVSHQTGGHTNPRPQKRNQHNPKLRRLRGRQQRNTSRRARCSVTVLISAISVNKLEHFSFAASPLPPRLRISRHQPPQRCRQTRRRAPQLIVMMQRQLSQHPFALRRQRQQHLAPVVLRPFPLHVPPTLKPVNQFHRAVMLNVHPIGQFPDPWPHPVRHSLDGQHELVLPHLHARRAHGLLAEAQKLPNLVPELRQSLVIRQGELLHAQSVSCRDSPRLVYRETIDTGIVAGDRTGTDPVMVIRRTDPAAPLLPVLCERWGSSWREPARPHPSLFPRLHLESLVRTPTTGDPPP